MSVELMSVGERVIATVSDNIATGAPLIKCKLLASEFYEALRHQLKNPDRDPARQRLLTAAADECHRIAMASRSPDGMLVDLRRAVDLLEVGIAVPGALDAPSRQRPVLRVIQGGRSSG